MLFVGLYIVCAFVVASLIAALWARDTGQEPDMDDWVLGCGLGLLFGLVWPILLVGAGIYCFARYIDQKIQRRNVSGS